MQVRLEDDARQDLRDVMAWITTESGASIAASIIDNILSSLEILADHPYIAEAYQIVPFRRMILTPGTSSLSDLIRRARRIKSDRLPGFLSG